MALGGGKSFATYSEFADFYELEEFQKSMDLTQQPTKITQLESGRPLIRSTQLDLNGSQLAVFEMSHKVKMETHLKPGESVLVLKLDRQTHVTWNGMQFPEWGVALMRGGSTYEIVHKSGCKLIEITLPDSLLFEFGMVELDADPTQIRLSEREGRLYAHRLLTLVEAPSNEDYDVEQLAIRKQTHTICAGLLDRLEAKAEPVVPERVARARVTRAERIIEERLRSPLDLIDLAKAVAVSPRTLQREFRKVLGTTPQAYLLARRLEAAKQQLRKGSLSTVADVSDLYGFSHPSRFAEQYKRHFGECPSSLTRS